MESNHADSHQWPRTSRRPRQLRSDQGLYALRVLLGLCFIERVIRGVVLLSLEKAGVIHTELAQNGERAVAVLASHSANYCVQLGQGSGRRSRRLSGRLFSGRSLGGWSGGRGGRLRRFGGLHSLLRRDGGFDSGRGLLDLCLKGIGCGAQRGRELGY